MTNLFDLLAGDASELLHKALTISQVLRKCEHREVYEQAGDCLRLASRLTAQLKSARFPKVNEHELAMAFADVHGVKLDPMYTFRSGNIWRTPKSGLAGRPAGTWSVSYLSFVCPKGKRYTAKELRKKGKVHEATTLAHKRKQAAAQQSLSGLRRQLAQSLDRLTSLAEQYQVSLD